MHFQGYNTGTVISSVLLPAASAVWTMSFADKKLLYGKLRVAVGGNSGENDDEDEEDEGDPACDVDVPPRPTRPSRSLPREGQGTWSR